MTIPKISLPTEAQKWKEFWQEIDAVASTYFVSEIDKFSYLLAWAVTKARCDTMLTRAQAHDLLDRLWDD